MDKDLSQIFCERMQQLIAENKPGDRRFNAPRWLANNLNITEAAVRKWLAKDGGAYPEATKLRQIALFFNVSTDWLLGLSNQRHVDSGAGLSADCSLVSFVEPDPVGLLRSASKLSIPDFMLPKDQAKTVFCMRNPTDAMFPTLRKGWPLLIETKIPQVEENEIHLAVVDGQHIALRRFQPTVGGLNMICDNKGHYAEILLEHSQVCTLSYLIPDLEQTSLAQRMLTGSPLASIIPPTERPVVIFGKVRSYFRSA